MLRLLSKLPAPRLSLDLGWSRRRMVSDTPSQLQGGRRPHFLRSLVDLSDCRDIDPLPHEPSTWRFPSFIVVYMEIQAIICRPRRDSPVQGKAYVAA